MKRECFFKITLLFVSLLIGFIIAEAAVRHIDKKNAVGENEEEKCTRDFLRRVSKSDPNNLLPTQVIYYEYIPYTGIRPKPNYSGFKYDNGHIDGRKAILKRPILQINSQGLVSHYDFMVITNKTRIAVFGDSFTFGTDVPYKYSYPYLLERIIPNSEVMNFGIEGIGVDTMYLRWKHEAKKFDPDIIVFAIYIDDIARMRPCIYKPKLFVENGTIKAENMPPPMTIEEFKKHDKHKFESYFIKHLKYILRNFGEKREAYHNGFMVLDPILREVRSNSKNFVVLIIEQGNNKNATEFEEKQIKRLKHLLDKNGVEYIELREILKNEGYTPYDYSLGKLAGHFMPEGYAILAQGIKNKLENMKIINKTDDYWFRLEHQGSIGRSALILYDKKTNNYARNIPAFDILLEDGSFAEELEGNLQYS